MPTTENLNIDVLQQIHEMCDNLYISSDTRQVVNFLSARIDNLFEIDHCSLVYRNRDDLWRVELIIGEMQSFNSFDEMMNSRIGIVIESGKAQVFNSASDVPPVSFSPHEILIPLLQSDSNNYGCIIFGNQTNFPASTIKLMRIFANRLSAIIIHVGHNQFLNQHNQLLKNQIQEMKTQIQELDAYNHTVAHDLKSPLSVITLKTDLVEAFDTLSPKSQKLLEDIRERVQYMSEMIDQLLTLTRVRDETDTFVMVDTNKILNNVLTRFVEIEDGTITLEIQPNLPMVMGHPQWIEELFANLISNAIKYMGDDNPDPIIKIHAEKQPLGAKFMITDNGIGIPADQLATLFNKFQRGEHSHIEGFGLGLAIVHRIITRLGGGIGVESDEGVGTTFWFTLFSRE